MKNVCHSFLDTKVTSAIVYSLELKKDMQWKKNSEEKLILTLRNDKNWTVLYHMFKTLFIFHSRSLKVDLHLKTNCSSRSCSLMFELHCRSIYAHVYWHYRRLFSLLSAESEKLLT